MKHLSPLMLSLTLLLGGCSDDTQTPEQDKETAPQTKQADARATSKDGEPTKALQADKRATTLTGKPAQTQKPVPIDSGKTPKPALSPAPPGVAGTVSPGTLGSIADKIPGGLESLFDRKHRPAVLSVADDPEYREANLRMMSPGMLSRVLVNSFCTDSNDDSSCIELEHNGENPLIYPYAQNMAASVAYVADPYQIMLGGIDYTYVLDRDRDPSGVTPLLMFNLIDSYCTQLVENGDVFPDMGSQDATIKHMYRMVRSRPISDEALSGAQSLVTGIAAARRAPVALRARAAPGTGPSREGIEIDKGPFTNISSSNKKNICRYFFLIDGGFILY